MIDGARVRHTIPAERSDKLDDTVRAAAVNALRRDSLFALIVVHGYRLLK